MINSKESAYRFLNEFRKVLFEVTLDKRSYEVETEYQFDKIIESLNRKEMEDRFPHPKESLEENLHYMREIFRGIRIYFMKNGK